MKYVWLGGLMVWLTTSVAAAESTAVKVMSFNVRYGTANDGDNHWERRKEFLAETVRAFGPDLLGTQETLGFQKDFLVERMDGYRAVGVGRDDGGPKGEMTAVLYREERFELLDHGHFWLSETPEIPGSKSWDTSLTRMATWLKLRDRQGPAGRSCRVVFQHALRSQGIAGTDGVEPTVAAEDHGAGGSGADDCDGGLQYGRGE